MDAVLICTIIFLSLSLFVPLFLLSRHPPLSADDVNTNYKAKGDDILSIESSVYIGQLQYSDIEFSFVFDKKELRLIPPKEKMHEIEMNWIMTPIGNGVYIMGSQLQMDELFLVGRCNEDGRKIVFLTQQGAHIGSKNSVLFIDIVAFIVCKMDRDSIDRISFSSPEVDCIHPVMTALRQRVLLCLKESP